MRILMIGDVIGKPGRRAVKSLIPSLRLDHGIDLVIANGENTAGGFGLTLDTANELLESGVDILTSGNHIWDQKEIIPYLDERLPVVRPANYPDAPGRGSLIHNNVMVMNLDGSGFHASVGLPLSYRRPNIRRGCRFQESHRLLSLDFHAEATSEKQAMGWYLDGRVSAILGTHTHVGTVDSRVLPRGTAYITDVGMTGPLDSVIGSETGIVLERFLTGMPQRLAVANGPVLLNSVLVDIDQDTGKALTIERMDRTVG